MRYNKKFSYRLKQGVSNAFSVAKLLSIAIMIYMYVYHLWNLRPVIELICYAHTNNKLQHATAVRMTRDATVVWCLFSRELLHIPNQTLYCQKLESINYMKTAIELVYLYFVVRSCFREPRKDVQDER